MTRRNLLGAFFAAIYRPRAIKAVTAEMISAAAVTTPRIEGLAITIAAIEANCLYIKESFARMERQGA